MQWGGQSEAKTCVRMLHPSRLQQRGVAAKSAEGKLGPSPQCGEAGTTQFTPEVTNAAQQRRHPHLRSKRRWLQNGSLASRAPVRSLLVVIPTKPWNVHLGSCGALVTPLKRAKRLARCASTGKIWRIERVLLLH